MGRDVPSPVAPSAHETTVEIGAGPADEEPMTAVSPVAPDHEHVSPELALVDPDLAGRLRGSLPEPELERALPPPTQPPREVETPRLRLAPTPFEAPAVAEPVVVEEQEPAVVAEPLVVEGLPEVVRPPEVVEEPVVVEEPRVFEEPQVFEESPVVTPADVLDEPHPVDEPRDFGPGPAADAFAPVTDLGEDTLAGASLRVEPRPVDIATPPALAPVATTTAAWPPVPEADADAEPERGRLRRLVFVFGLGMVAASLAVVGLVALFGDPDPPPPLTLAGPTPSPSPQPASGDPQGSSSPSTPSTSSSGGKQSSQPAAVPPAGSRRLVWAPVEGAVSYRVELFRGERQIFRDTTRSPAIVLPARWKHEGRAERLTPGTYRWYVWPVTSSGPAATAVVQAELVVP